LKYNSEIHHRKSIRLKGFDYSRPEKYFITICTPDKTFLFGRIRGDKMILNPAGRFADGCWEKIPEHFPNAILHSHVVMPNHVHGIIELKRIESVGAQHLVPLLKTSDVGSGVQNIESLPAETHHSSAPHAAFKPLRKIKIEKRGNRFQKIIPYSIGSIARGFKIGVTKWFHENTDIDVVWQRNFHEHIIRNDEEYYKISNYISTNPKNWKEDAFYV